MQTAQKSRKPVFVWIVHFMENITTVKGVDCLVLGGDCLFAFSTFVRQ